MADIVRIQMMGTFAIYINERKIDLLVNKSRKGASLIQLLISHRGKSVPNSRLLSTLWTEEKSSNPENALKTLVSRLRTLLNQISPDLGSCVVADRGAYHWACLPGMTVDLYEIDHILDILGQEGMDAQEKTKLYEGLMNLYSGDLLQSCDHNEWAVAEAAALHEKYMKAVFDYIELLKESCLHREIISACRRALEVDNFHDTLHIELMKALIHMNRPGEALQQYKHVVELDYRYLGVQPSAELQEFYKQIVTAGKTLDFNLKAIRNELRENDKKDAYVCEYAVFKEIYNLQMRNLERMGTTMFLAIIMVRPYDDQVMDNIRRNSIMNGLRDILAQNLRKGDIITRFAPAMFALLLPTVNYATGHMVLERIKRVFYRQYPNSNVVFDYRVGPLDGEEEEVADEKENPEI
ncbi:MAG: hypothetical protein E7316_10095 [Clostridiales bacterium]|nr:hypothetical protein [Clostridiales bacterium]